MEGLPKGRSHSGEILGGGLKPPFPLAGAQLESWGPLEYEEMGALPSEARRAEAYAAGGPGAALGPRKPEKF